MRTAFKEWAAVCAALASGRQTIILRKGGVAEPNGRFRPEHDEFLLFPTYAHQSRAGLIPDAQNLLDESIATRPPDDEIHITHFAKVEQALPIRSLQTLAALRNQHVWADRVIEERFHRWRKDSVYLIVVRVYALLEPVVLPMRSHYGGCSSWATLDEDVSIDNAAPVLEDEEFARRTEDVDVALR